MPVTLSGNTHSQPEHPPSTEPTELSGTGLGRTGRPGLHGAVREKARVCHPRHTSLVKSVRPSPDRNTATIVALSFVFLFFLSNTSATECKFPHQFSVRNKQLYGNCSRTSWVQYFSDLWGDGLFVVTWSTDVILLLQVPEEKKNQTSPRE